jgi:SAM-dependent methyltransferase
VTAIDSSQVMVAEAQKRSAGLGLPVRFKVGDAHHLEWERDTFDGCLCDRSFMHLAEPARALREMVRVAKPGAPVVVFEVDFETITLDVPDRALARKVLHSYTDGFRDGWLGRRIPGLFHDAGLQHIVVHPHTLRLNFELAMQVAGPATVDRARSAGLLSAAEADDWLHHLHAAHEAGRFFSTLTGFLVAGRKHL